MIQVQDKIISLDIFEKYFVCDLNACKGACCVEGDSGAPLTTQEEKKIKIIYQKIKPYMIEQGILEIEKQGVAVYDLEGDLTTPLVNNRQCAFVIYENGISKCAIEKAYMRGDINFRKPISCHLFPIRIKEYRDFDAVNYQEIKICQPACECGSKLKIPLYVFLKDSLIRKYGESWYKELLEAAKLLG
tara:strand:+ start:4016 stop:4579 length:564 start_codon:yes stop_codon:yes gene_type:complete